MTIPGRAGGRRPLRSTIRLALLAALPEVIAFVLGNLATFPNLGWYATLRRPPYNPPDWLFGPAWTALYLAMAVALYRVLRRPPGTPRRGAALVAFVVQIALNAAWSFAFFAAHSPLAGLVVILGLVAAIAVTIGLFLKIDRLAAGLMVPYLAWVGFATVLDASILVLNR